VGGVPVAMFLPTAVRDNEAVSAILAAAKRQGSTGLLAPPKPAEEKRYDIHPLWLTFCNSEVQLAYEGVYGEGSKGALGTIILVGTAFQLLMSLMVSIERFSCSFLLVDRYYEGMWPEVLSSACTVSVCAYACMSKCSKDVFLGKYCRCRGSTPSSIHAGFGFLVMWLGTFLVCVQVRHAMSRWSTSQCFDDKVGMGFLSSQCDVSQLLTNPSFHDSVGWFRSVLLFLPLIGLTLQVSFPAIAISSVMSTSFLCFTLFMHPSRALGRSTEHSHAGPPVNVSNSVGMYGMGGVLEDAFGSMGVETAERPAVDDGIPPPTTAARLFCQHFIPCLSILLLIYLVQLQRLRMFASLHKQGTPRAHAASLIRAISERSSAAPAVDVKLQLSDEAGSVDGGSGAVGKPISPKLQQLQSSRPLLPSRVCFRRAGQP